MLKRLAFAAVLLIPAVFLAAPTSAAPARVEICHYPPGNAENPQTLIVSERALEAHLSKHGDTLGPCPTGCQLDASTCDDNDLCTEDICNPDGSCDHVDLTASCDDSNSCTLDTCDAAIGCVNAPLVGQSCDDGDLCTLSASCDAAGECVPDSQRPNCCRSDSDCLESPDDLCTVNERCDVTTYTCLSDPVICEPSNACVVNTCVSDAGCVSTPTNCDDGNFCTDDSCVDVIGCVHTPTEDPPEPSEEPFEDTCRDGLDNDCDGFTDCEDVDCCGDPDCGRLPICTGDQCCESRCPELCEFENGWTGSFICEDVLGDVRVVCDCNSGFIRGEECFD